MVLRRALESAVRGGSGDEYSSDEQKKQALGSRSAGDDASSSFDGRLHQESDLLLLETVLLIASEPAKVGTGRPDNESFRNPTESGRLSDYSRPTSLLACFFRFGGWLSLLAQCVPFAAVCWQPRLHHWLHPSLERSRAVAAAAVIQCERRLGVLRDHGNALHQSIVIVRQQEF